MTSKAEKDTEDTGGKMWVNPQDRCPSTACTCHNLTKGHAGEASLGFISDLVRKGTGKGGS